MLGVNMRIKQNQLTVTMEDYLEAIYNLKIKSQVARIRDIADYMHVKMPSATGAIRTLASKGLVWHTPYDAVDLTEDGLKYARDITHRHEVIQNFLTGVLDMNGEEAYTEACTMEHAIAQTTLNKLIMFVEFVDKDPNVIENFKKELRNKAKDIDLLTELSHTTQLSSLKPGAKGRIAFVSGEPAIRRRLMEMGLISNTHFKVMRVAPLGDPVEIAVRGYFLSLRKSEADGIEVEVE